MNGLDGLTRGEALGLETKQNILDTAKQRIQELEQQIRHKKNKHDPHGIEAVFVKLDELALRDLEHIVSGNLDIDLKRFKRLVTRFRKIERLLKTLDKLRIELNRIKNARDVLGDDFRIIEWDDDDFVF